MTDRSAADVVAHAPGRVNLIGDHTDHAGGLALPMAIDLGTTISGRRADRIRLTSDAEPGAAVVTLDGSPSARALGSGWARYVAAVAAELGHPLGVEGRVTTTLPLGAGLSSSAALEVAVALALGHDGSPLELARLAQRAEQRATGVPCGLMDQLTSACGRPGHALLVDFATLAVSAVPLPDGIDVLVVHSGEQRRLDQSAYAERRRACEAAAEVIGPLPAASEEAVARVADPVLRRRARHVASECRRVAAAAEALADGDVAAVGGLMVESHASLRDDFEVSTPALDATVEALLAVPGVHGARLTGAGFGGCVVALADAGAVADPAALTGRGWLVRAAGPAGLLEG